MIKQLKTIFKEDNLEYEFLPPALEIERTPPPPFGRVVIWVILIVTVLAVVWSYFGKVDQVAVARGKVVPDGKVKVIQPMEEGIIRAINVEEGRWVKEGDVLLELDPTFKQADVESTIKLLSMYISDSERLKAELSGGNIESKNISPDILQYQQKFKDAKESEFIARENALKLSILQKEDELNKANANMKYLEKVVPIIGDEEKSYRFVSENGGLSKMDLYNKQKELYSAEKELELQKSIISQTESSIEEAKKNLDAIKKEREKLILSELLEKERYIASMEGESIKAKKKFELGMITSPVDGYVQDLATHTVGGIVSPAQSLITIVPDGTPLIVEAKALNIDVGFLEVGQEVEIKLDTFSFQKYGTLKGILKSISPDAFEDEKLGPVYKIRVEMEDTSLNIDGRTIKVVPGMAVSAEIKTGKRRIIEFFLSPIIKYAKESLTVR